MIAIIIEDSLIQAINYSIGSQPKVNDENLTDIQRYKLRFPPCCEENAFLRLNLEDLLFSCDQVIVMEQEYVRNACLDCLLDDSIGLAAVHMAHKCPLSMLVE